jgi:hypothetical protein
VSTCLRNNSKHQKPNENSQNEPEDNNWDMNFENPNDLQENDIGEMNIIVDANELNLQLPEISSSDTNLRISNENVGTFSQSEFTKLVKIYFNF